MTDDELDSIIRDLAVPDDARRSVALERLFADEPLDRLLARVAVPKGLADRVRAADRRPARGDGSIDLARIAAPAMPHDVGTGRRPWRRLLGPIREAVTVAAALSLVGFVFLAGSALSRRLEGAGRGRAANGGPVARITTPAFATEPSPVVVAAGAGSEPAPPAASRDPAMAPLVVGSDDGRGGAAAEAASAPAAATVAAVPAAPLVRGAPVDSAPAAARGMRTVALPGDARRPVPRSPAFDLAFEMTHGESPFVDPAADAALAVDRPPLSLSTDSFEWLIAGPDRGRPAASRIRAEEILAALPGPASPEPGVSVAARTVPGLRSIGGRPTLLLEATVSAAGRGTHGGEPLRTTFVLDQAEAGDPLAWPRICRGLAAVAETMAAADRVSIIVCGPRPRVAVHDADARRLAAVAADLEPLPTVPSSDPDAALELARSDGAGTVVFIAHAATLDRGRIVVREALADWREALAADGGDPGMAAVAPCRFVVLDTAAPSGMPRSEPSFGRTAPDSTAIRRAVLAATFGRDTLVARQCSLEVRFDPRLVAAYRIVGHRQSAVESLADSPPAPIDLHAGETARVVYEVVPRTAVVAGLATAEAEWLPGDGGGRRRAAALATAPTPAAGGRLSVRDRELVVAVGVGELAAGSAHVGRRGELVAEVAALVADWRAGGDLTPFGVGLVRLFDRHVTGRREVR